MSQTHQQPPSGTSRPDAGARTSLYDEVTDRIVHELEQGEVPLEKSLTLFEEGMQLSASCRKELEEAEGKVEILLKQNGKIQAEPFER